MKEHKPVGLTKDSGFQIGVRKTYAISVTDMWNFLLSPHGLSCWLGATPGPLEEKSTYHTTDGITGVVKLIKPYSHLRLTWKKKQWDNFSSLQLRLINSNGKCTVSFHQDQLTGPEQREAMKTYWIQVQENIGKAFDK